MLLTVVTVGGVSGSLEEFVTLSSVGFGVLSVIDLVVLPAMGSHKTECIFKVMGFQSNGKGQLSSNDCVKGQFK